MIFGCTEVETTANQRDNGQTLNGQERAVQAKYFFSTKYFLAKYFSAKYFLAQFEWKMKNGWDDSKLKRQWANCEWKEKRARLV